MEFMQIVVVSLVFLGWLIPSPLSWFGRRSLEKRHKVEVDKFDDEIKRLKMLLNTKMEAEAEGTMQRKNEIENLKQVNQNLQITIQTLSTKPEQAELRLLHIYDRALKILQCKSPGFVPTWQKIVSHVEKEMKQADQGATALVKRAFLLGKLAETDPPLLGQKPPGCE